MSPGETWRRTGADFLVSWDDAPVLLKRGDVGVVVKVSGTDRIRSIDILMLRIGRVVGVQLIEGRWERVS